VIRLCKENATGKHFMAKIVPYEAERKQSVLQEYEILKVLHHERIMALHEAYITPRYLVLICENCAGKEILYSIVDRYGRARGLRQCRRHGATRRCRLPPGFATRRTTW